ncbi:hypothetical protein J6590_062421 [Homalodisca vitripennis]|nr:hypothetical protein J6590_062421 [Homalodisca vitripennis]
MRPTSLQLQQFNKPPKTTYQVLLGKFTTPVQATKDGIPLSCYCRAIKEQVLSSLLLLITPSTERILPKDANPESAAREAALFTIANIADTLDRHRDTYSENLKSRDQLLTTLLSLIQNSPTPEPLILRVTAAIVYPSLAKHLSLHTSV